MSVLAVGPYLKGLFFWTSLLGAITAISAGFGLWVVGRRLSGEDLSHTTFEYLRRDWAAIGLIGLAACYAVQFPWAVYQRGNMDVFLRVVVACFAYFMVSIESGPNLRRLISWLVLISACAVGLLGYLQYLGVLDRVPSLVEILPWDQVPGGTVIGSFEYHNATAILLLAGFLVAVGVAVERGRALLASLLGGVATFLSLVFFFAQSRGAVVVMPFALLALVAGLDSERRFMGIAFMGTSVLPALLVVKKVGDAISARMTFDTAVWTALACLVGCVCGPLLRLPLLMSPKVRSRVLYAGIALAVLAAVVLVSTGTLARFLPKQAARYGQIDLEGASSRFRYYADALKVIKSSPWGLGGWGWSRVYHSVQSVDYIGREVHCHYLQVAIEAGIQGLAAFLLAIGALVVRAWRTRGSDGPGWALASAGLALAAHSAIDFDLSYGYLWLLLWVLLAAAAPLAPRARDGEHADPEELSDGWPVGWRRRRVWDRQAISFVALVAVALASFVLSGRLFLGSRLVDRLMEIPTGTDRTPVAQEAVRYDPWSTEALLALNTREALEKALRLDPMNPEPHWQMCLWLEREYDTGGALREAEAALELYPWIPNYFSKVADLRGLLMLEAAAEGDNQTALQMAETLVDLYNEVAERTPISPHLRSWSKTSVSSAIFSLRCGQALFLSGQETDAVQPLKDATRVAIISHEANLWLFTIYERAGDQKAASALLSEPMVRLRNVNPTYKAIRDWTVKH